MSESVCSMAFRGSSTDGTQAYKVNMCVCVCSENFLYFTFLLLPIFAGVALRECIK